MKNTFPGKIRPRQHFFLEQRDIADWSFITVQFNPFLNRIRFRSLIFNPRYPFSFYPFLFSRKNLIKLAVTDIVRYFSLFHFNADSCLDPFTFYLYHLFKSTLHSSNASGTDFPARYWKVRLVRRSNRAGLIFYRFTRFVTFSTAAYLLDRIIEFLMHQHRASSELRTID